MADVMVDADLLVDNGAGGKRQLSVDDLKAARTLAATEATLEAVRALLAATLTVGGTVALDAATLAALESTTVTVANPTANPETGLAKEATLAGTLPRDVTDRAARLLGHVTVDNSDARDQSEAFRRLLKFEPLAGEEIRREETASYDYHGAAPEGTLDTALAWKVVRFDRSVSGLLKVRYRSGVAWADRAVGW